MNPDHLIHRFAYMKNEIPVAGVAHQAGTCRFGTDPASSALDANCKAHELDNLYVVDTSIFPSIGAVNPALTAMANSLRVGDHLLERLCVPSDGTVAPSGEQVEISFEDQRAVVVEVGGGLRSYSAGGRDVLDGYGVGEQSASGRGQVLVPWPNRLQDGSYEFDGRSHQLPLTEPEHAKRDPRPRPLGGVAHRRARGPPRGDGARDPPPARLSVYAWARASSTRSRKRGLSVRTTARNLGSDACPYGCGQHPYLTLGTPTVDTVELQAPGQRVLISDERDLPTGSEPVEGTEYDFRAARAIGTTRLDNAFTDLARDDDGRARVRLRDPDGERR